jgi:ribosomal protein S18 acetylase RimI-like enzyme
MTEDVLLHIRPARADDDLFLQTLYLRACAPDLDPLLGRMQWEAQRRGYAARFPTAQDQVLVCQREEVGRLLVCPQPQAYWLVDLALLPQWQRLGLGTQALRWALEQARPLRLPARLSVLASNHGARHLYQRLGFTLINQAPPYVQMEHPGLHTSSTTAT